MRARRTIAILLSLAVGLGLAACTRDAGRAAACRVDADCGAPFRCEAGGCVPKAADGCGGLGACLGAYDCGGGICRDGCCRPPCASALDCADGETCRAGACVEVATGCAGAADCAGVAGRPHCEPTSARCVECLAPGDCGDAALTCSSEGRCELVPGRCRRDEDCPAGGCGADGLCGSAGRCDADGDCAAPRPYCDVASGACAACVTGRGCPAEKPVCAAGACVECDVDADCRDAARPRCAPASGLCVACTTDGHCVEGSQCVANRCQASGCRADRDCAADPVAPRCRPDTGRCVACTLDGHCPSGARCDADRCVPVAGLDAPCTAASGCPASLACIMGASGNGACRAPCDLYAPNCVAPRRCGIARFSAAGAPDGYCLPDVGGVEGESCSPAQPCRPGLACVDDRPSGLNSCRPLCDLARPGATCAAPAACQPLATRDATGVPRSYGACFARTRLFSRCGDDAACDPGQACAADVDGAEPTAVANLCRWPLGGKGAAVECDAGSECRSGHCLSGAPRGYGSANDAVAGFCQGACTRDADCRAANGLPGACGWASFSWYDPSGAPSRSNVTTCFVQCRGELDCRPGDTCVPIANADGTAWTRRCLDATQGAARRGGAPCTANDQCASGVCFQRGNDGYCLGACDPGDPAGCDAAASCPASGVRKKLPGPDLAYGTGDDRYGAAPMCWGKACVRDADCAGLSADPAAPRVCVADVDPSNADDVLLSCAPRTGNMLGGAACARDDECATGWCVPWTKNGVTLRRCFGGCVGEADCTSTPSARTFCTSMTLRSGSTRPVSLCVPVF